MFAEGLGWTAATRWLQENLNLPFIIILRVQFLDEVAHALALNVQATALAQAQLLPGLDSRQSPGHPSIVAGYELFSEPASFVVVQQDAEPQLRAFGSIRLRWRSRS